MSNDPATRPAVASPRRPLATLFVAVLALAGMVRVVQWSLQQADPLFHSPLGGNLPYLLLGERIAGGELLPLDGRPFSISSPLYPWIVGAVFALVGESDVGALRLTGAIVDALGCALLALLAARTMGGRVGWATGVLAALYGPLVYFSVEPTPVPFTLALLVGGLLATREGLGGGVALTGAGSGGGLPSTGEGLSGDQERRGGTRALLLLGGVLVGLAVGTRPNLLLGALILPLVPWALRREGGEGTPRRLGPTLLLAGGLALGIAPVTGANWAASGEFVPLTTGAGHNFYIGHNPMAQPQYALPFPLDGDIFLSLKSVAEAETGRALADTEVSGFYLDRGLRWIAENPDRELRLFGARALSAIGDFEATTYGSVEYQEFWSPLLRVLPGFAVLFALALVGVVVRRPRREDLLLWIPALAGFSTILLFFYIARLRMLVVPTLLIWAGVGLVALFEAARAPARRRALLLFVPLALLGWTLSSLPRYDADPSNEWNKAGGLLRVRGFPEEAERFFERAIEANPENPSSWRNLAVLYRETGRMEEALQAEARAAELAARGAAEREAWTEAVEGG